RFRGIDLIWYGPFKAGDAVRIPADDAEFWIRKGYASYTPTIVIPPVYTYVTVYAKIGISAFTGVDGKVYGPYKAGDAMVIPKEDADMLVAADKATYSPPIPAEIPVIAKTVSELLGRVSLKGVSDAVSALRSTVDDFKISTSTAVTRLTEAIDRISSLLSTVISISVVTIVLVAVAIAFIFLRTKSLR
ncbi:MAG: hypothetical protein RMJ00_02680, partial [Nitrososphaerota archaeon]|nr:hypothetical protein [Nitrososphaerota archaeon]